ncbi:MAG: hypothetical protein KIT36_19690, partial [Alphaproteobacteria bacterium]|nr:hypothetical protein [Alphaproteobacteria bacterium]
EAGLVGTNPKVERRRALIRYAAFAATGLFFLTAVGLWTWSYFDNRALISKVEEEVRRLEPQIAEAERQRAAARTAPDFDPRKHIRLLNDLRALPTGYEQQQNKTQAAVGFGLGQTDRLALQTTELYKRGLRALLLPHIMVHAQSRMAAILNKPRPAPADEAAVNEYLFEALKAYLLLGETQRINTTYRKFIVDWYRNDFADTSGFTTGDANALAIHIAALVEDPTWDQITLDQALIARVRDRISALTVSSRALRWLEADEALRNRPAWRVIDNVGAQRAVAEEVLVSQRGAPLATISIPYLYTRAGYYEFFINTVAIAAAAANADAWVLRQSTLTGAPAVNQVVGQTIKDYMERYINYYRGVVEDIRVVRLNDLGQSASVLNKLSSGDSPIRNLYEAVAQQTRLSQVQKVSPELLALRGNVVQRMLRNIQDAAAWILQGQRILGDGSLPGQSVDREFEALHRFTGQPGATSSPLTSFLDNFRLIATKASDARGGDETALRQVIQLARQLSDQSGQYPRPLPEIARTIAVDVSNLGAKGTREQMAAAWDSQIFNICQRNIVNMYPINLGAAASRDATPDDFADMFGKGGRIDKFIQQYLQSYLDTGSNPWRWKPEAQSLAFNLQVPVMLQAAAEIQDSFFSPGGGSLGVIFTMRALEGQMKGAGLEIAGDTMQLEPQSGPKNISWPSGAGRGARVFSDTNEQRFDGQWAFMRMMIASSPTGNGPEWRLRLSNGVALQLEFQKPKNPLTVRPLLIQRKFQCVPLLQQ